MRGVTLVVGGTVAGTSGMGHVGGGVGAEWEPKVAIPGFTKVQFLCLDLVRDMFSLIGDWSCGVAPLARPGSSSSFHVFEFIRVRPKLAWVGAVGDSGGDASKVFDGAVGAGAEGGGGKYPIERDDRRLPLPEGSEDKYRKLLDDADNIDDIVPRRET